MKDYTQLNQAVYKIAEFRHLLSQKSYEDADYDELEDKLHDLEDSFIDEQGRLLEQIIEEVYEQLCPDDEVLSPLAYLATTYKKVGDKEGVVAFDVDSDQGIAISIETSSRKEPRLVVLPNPLRVILNVDSKTRYRVWPSEAES